MIDNEIESFEIEIPLTTYIRIIYPFDKSSIIRLGTIQYYKSIGHLACTDITTRNLIYILGDNTKSNMKLCQDGNNIKEIDSSKLSIKVNVVLKEQIKNLKYVEQLNLFPDGKDNE